MVKNLTCRALDFDSIPKHTVDLLNMVQLSDGSIVNSVVLNNIADVRIMRGTHMSIWNIPLNTLCVLLINTERNGHDSALSQFGVEFEMLKQGADYCLKCGEDTLTLPKHYWTRLSSLYVDPVSEAMKGKGFKFVGTREQGGYLCPKCGNCNNAYTFDGHCQTCGY